MPAPAAERDPGGARYARVIVEVAPSHLDRPFDYLVPDGTTVEVGQRVRVVFAGRRRTGWVIDLADRSDADPQRIRPLALVQGERTWFDRADLPWLRWIAERYAAPLADVLRHALPQRVAAVDAEARRWPPASPPRPADRPPCPAATWRPYGASGLLRATGGTASGDGPAPAFWLRTLPGDDEAAMVADLVARTSARGRSALVLVPDPASPVAAAVLASAGPSAADLRPSGERGAERARYRSFLRCRTGHASVAVGERSAVFTPLPDLGLIVVVDEANPAYKERRSPRHHAREVALARARMGGAPCVLTGDLPSAQLWRLLEAGHVAAVRADRTTERRRAPRIDVADLGAPRPGSRRARFTDLAARAVSEAVGAGGATVVLAARGGQGSALACRRCRARLACPICAGSLRPLGAGDEERWGCAACGWEDDPFACPECGGTTFSPLAAGAGRLAQELARSHPAAEVVRMEGFDAPGPSRRPGIGVMTRGSVVARPGWLGGAPAEVTVLPDADAMLNRPTLGAAEDALRLWFAVARWSRRVVVQTREPAHPAVQALVRWDPEGFWRREAGRRGELRYPPSASLVRLRAATDFAGEMARALSEALPADDEVLGPDADGAVLVKSGDLHGTLAALRPLHHGWDRDDRKVRVDVDPTTLD